MAPAKRVCVLGAGVVGLSTALRLRQKLPGVEVTLVAEHFDAGTTSIGAGGLWQPYSLGETPEALVNQWGSETFEHLQGLALSDQAALTGAQMVSSYMGGKERTPEPFWKDAVPAFRAMTRAELAGFAGAGWTHGWAFLTVICEPRRYLPWLQRRFLEAGGKVVERRITALEQLREYDLLVNCSGLGSAKLFGDTLIEPVRGQTIRVKAPWIKHYMCGDYTFYIIPNVDTLVLGGTLQKGRWDTEPTEEDRRRIWEGCCAMCPALRSPEVEVVADWAGLRPVRSPVRLEAEVLQVGGRALPVVHNYGHGGSGVTLHWGCAAHAVRLAGQLLSQQPQHTAAASRL